jgi:uncharacterized alpha-E superfamily protein
MTDKEDDKEATDKERHQAIIDKLNKAKESMSELREQSSQEHGSIINHLSAENKETRAHMGSEVETMRADLAHTKNFMRRVLDALKRFLARMGIASDDL